MQITLDVQGMSCGHCEKSVKGALNDIKGVQTVEVLLSEGKVNVTYDEGQVTVTALQDAIEAQGYDVVA